MAQLPVAAMAWIASHHGVIDGRRLRDVGLTPGQIERRLASGRLVAVQRGVYRSAEWPDSETARCLAACLAAPAGAISCRTAGRLWGLRRCAGADLVLTVPTASRVRLAGVEVRRCRLLADHDLVRRPDGIKLTSPVRTVCDLAAVLGEEDLASVIEQVLDEFGVQYVTLRRTAERLIARGRPGAARLRSVLDGRPPTAAAHDSHLEVRLAGALV